MTASLNALRSAAGSDPLAEFRGRWTTELAERYLPVPQVPAGKYECLEGHLTMSPHERPANSYGELRLGVLMHEAVRSAGYLPYLSVNMRFAADTWIEPDLTVLTARVAEGVWVPASKVLMPVEFLSPSSKDRDRIDKPKLCAAAGVPWFMTVELDPDNRGAYVWLDRLRRGEYIEHASAREGQRLRVTDPFTLDFDPADLLEP